MDPGPSTIPIRRSLCESDLWIIIWVLGVRQTHEKFLQTTIRDYDGFYANLMRHVIEFFKTGMGGFPGELAMELVAVLEYADKSRALDGSWVEMPT